MDPRRDADPPQGGAGRDQHSGGAEHLRCGDGYTPAGGEPVAVRVIARRADTIVGFGDTRIHAEAAMFEVRASEVANPRPGDQLTVSGETFVVQGEPERRDPERVVWTVDVRPA